MSYIDKLKEKYLHPTTRKSKNKPQEELAPVEVQPTQPPSTEHIVPTDQTYAPEPKSIVKTVRVGAHVSMQYGFKQAMEYAKSEGYNCAQLFTTSPRTTKITKQIDPVDAEECKQYIIDNDMELWIHCAYTINFCRECCEDSKYQRDCIVNDMKKAMMLGASGCVIHCGKLNSSYGVIDEKDAIPNFKMNIEHTITELLKDNPIELPWLLIETAAGQGTETPVTIEGLATLYNSIEPTYRKYIGFCIDTCHVFASGECDMRDPDKIDAFIAKWNGLIGWTNVKLIHFNDSECSFKSRKDRHAEPGKGCIGTKGLEYFKQFCGVTGKSLVTEY